MTARLQVALLFGGRSGEHEVSLASAASVAASMMRSLSFSAARSVAVLMRESAAAFCSAVIFSFLMRRS